MFRLLLDFFLLWKSVPVLLNYFGFQRVWIDVDVNEVPVSTSGLPVNGSHRVFATSEAASVAGLAAGYSVYNIFFGGRS